MTGSSGRNDQVCDKPNSTRLNRTGNFLTDEKGHQYKALLLGWDGCSKLAQGKAKRFTIVYQPLALPVSNLVVQYSDHDSSSISIPVQVR
jgi:hypothetical protein